MAFPFTRKIGFQVSKFLDSPGSENQVFHMFYDMLSFLEMRHRPRKGHTIMSRYVHDMYRRTGMFLYWTGLRRVIVDWCREEAALPGSASAGVLSLYRYLKVGSQREAGAA